VKKILIACVALMFAATACPANPPAVDYTACPAAGSGQIQVAVVVENSVNKVVCVVVPDGADGFAALNARAARIGAPALRFNGAFLCAIDGNPVGPACGTDPAGPNGFSYWSYNLGGTTWSEAQFGAASRVLHQGDVDGWVYGTWNFSTTFPGAPTTASDFATLTN